MSVSSPSGQDKLGAAGLPVSPALPAPDPELARISPRHAAEPAASSPGVGAGAEARERQSRPRLMSLPFFLLWLGQAVSQLGNQAFAIAMLFWTKESIGSASLLGGMMIAGALPGLLLSPFGGTFADRHDRLRIVIACDTISGLAMLGLTGIFIAAPHNRGVVLGTLVCIAVIEAAVGAFFGPAIQAQIPHLVPAERLASANSLYQLTGTLSVTSGQAIGGVLYRVLGPPLLFLADSLSFFFAAGSTGLLVARRRRAATAAGAGGLPGTAPALLAAATAVAAGGGASPSSVPSDGAAPTEVTAGSAGSAASAEALAAAEVLARSSPIESLPQAVEAAFLAGEPPAGAGGPPGTAARADGPETEGAPSPAGPEAPPHPFREFLQETAAGLRYVWSRPGLRDFMLLASLLNFIIIPMAVLFPFYVEDVLHVGPAWYGFLIGGSSTGALVGMLLAGLLRLRGTTRAWTLVACIAVGPALVAALGFVRVPAAAVALTFSSGVVLGLVNIYVVTMLQTSTPDSLRGRVLGLLGTLAGGLTPIGMALGGIAGDLTGKNIPLIFGTCGGLALLLTLLLATRPACRAFLAQDGTTGGSGGSGPSGGNGAGGTASGAPHPAAA